MADANFPELRRRSTETELPGYAIPERSHIMFFVDTLEFEGLGNRSYLAGGRRAAVVVDPPRDVDQVIALAARRRVRIA